MLIENNPKNSKHQHNYYYYYFVSTLLPFLLHKEIQACQGKAGMTKGIRSC